MSAIGDSIGRSELQRRRDELAEQVAQLHWDLGGLTYEMAIRDHFRLDVLVRRAALLQERDAELAPDEAATGGRDGEGEALRLLALTEQLRLHAAQQRPAAAIIGSGH